MECASTLMTLPRLDSRHRPVPASLWSHFWRRPNQKRRLGIKAEFQIMREIATTRINHQGHSGKSRLRAVRQTDQRY